MDGACDGNKTSGLHVVAPPRSTISFSQHSLGALHSFRVKPVRPLSSTPHLLPSCLSTNYLVCPGGLFSSLAEEEALGR